MGNRSRDELFKFLDYLKAKGLMNTATIEARRASAGQVLGILDDKEAADVTVIDLDTVIERFNNLHGKKYTPESLRSYKSRTKAAIDDFARYVENPLAFKPKLQLLRRKVVVGKSAGAPKPSQGQANVPATPTISDRPAMVPAASSNILPIPLRSDLTIFIQGLPFDLSASEAKRIASVVQAMAMIE